jgi:hypothetical protein
MLPKFGMVPPKESIQYKVEVETRPSAVWGKNEVINHANKEAVTRAVNKTRSDSMKLRAFGLD